MEDEKEPTIWNFNRIAFKPIGGTDYKFLLPKGKITPVGVCSEEKEVTKLLDELLEREYDDDRIDPDLPLATRVQQRKILSRHFSADLAWG